MAEDTSNTVPDERTTDLGVVDSLVQLSFLVQSVLTRAGAAHDLSITQLRLLGIVRDRDAGMMDLAEHLSLDKSSVTGLVDRAEKRALVQRSRAPGDGRALRVSITGGGLELADVVATAVQEGIAALTGVLTTRQQAQLSALASAVVAGAYHPSTGRRPQRLSRRT